MYEPYINADLGKTHFLAAKYFLISRRIRRLIFCISGKNIIALL